MMRFYAVLITGSILNFAGLVYGFDIDEVILKDMIYPGSDLCTNNDGNTDITYSHTPSPSYWDIANSGREAKNFMAQMTHTDSDSNRNWTIRFGKGGTIYSMRSGYGEAIPPQTSDFSPWVDEVTQSVAVDTVLNQQCASDSGKCWFIHQAGQYFQDTTYLDEPFYSPNVGRHCEGNTCIFATWGQIAKNPTIFESDLLYFHQYRDCGDGVLEYTQMFVGYFGGSIAYLNIPWAGVRESSLPDLYLSNPDDDLTMADKEPTIPYWGQTGQLKDLQDTGGYSTFAQNNATINGDNAALSYVHGQCKEFNDRSNTYFRAENRMRFGKSRRDFTVFTINGQFTSTNPENIYVNRQFLINDELGNIQAKAKPLVPEAFGDMLTSSDFSGRILEVYFEDTSNFGVAAASEPGGTSTTCYRGAVHCVGSTVPGSQRVPFFTIKCGSLTYFGPDKYHFAPAPDADEKIRSYVCDGQAKGVVPEWKLIGFFTEGDCGSLSDAVYDHAFCEAPPTDYELYADGEGGGICAPGKAVTEEECLNAGNEVTVGIMDDLSRHSLLVGAWPALPCGCFIYNDQFIDYKDPANVNCSPHLISNLVCRKEAVAVTVTDYELYADGEGGGICAPGKAVTEEECLNAGNEVTVGIMNDLDRTRVIVGAWPALPCGCFIYNDQKIDYKDPANVNCSPHLISNLVCRK